MRRITTTAPLVLALLVCGCGGDEDKVTLVPVSGKITRNGKPLAGAKVTFVPDATNKESTPGVDETGPEGNYKLKYKTRYGVAVGKYTVVVDEPIALDASKVPDAFKDDPYMAQLSQTGGGTTTKKKAAGEKWEFEANVESGGGEFEFDVKASSGTTKAATKS
ncbi:MAG: carboxypeptidase regulatory-like domain-containing protein [Isosphaeraceae bacterium]